MKTMPQHSGSRQFSELPDFYGLVADDLNTVHQLILQQMNASEPLIKTIGDYMLNSGGKLMRPLLVLLITGHCGYRGKQGVILAAAIECLHTATLLHDDIVDASKLRRGQPTVNDRWDNPSGVLIGDYLYAKAFQLLVGIGNIRILKIIAEAAGVIAEGEVMQLTRIGDTKINEQDYREIIRCKTAILFQASAEAAAALAEVPQDTEQCLRDFGLYLGLTYQLIDDALDYSGSAGKLGKGIGDDLAEGKITLPLIHVLTRGSEEHKAVVARAIKSHSTCFLDDTIATVKASGALAYTEQVASQECQKGHACLAQLDTTAYSGALKAMLNHALMRQA